MISTVIKAAARETLLSRLTDSAQARITRSTVKLEGGIFTGSGVIVTSRVRGGRCEIVVATAAHNLRIYIDGLSGQARQQFAPPEAWTLEQLNHRKDDMIAAFIQGARIHYDGANMTLEDPVAVNGQAAISRIILPDWRYDACLLFADVPMTARPRCEVYAIEQEAAVARNVCTYLQQHGSLEQGWSLLQVGYGRTDPDQDLSVGTRNAKISSFLGPAGGRPTEYWDSVLETNQEVMKLESSAEWTTLPGDSGGPLYAVYAPDKVAVIGVTLGSDVFKTRQEDEAARADADGAHNNAVTSLAKLYNAWAFDGRSQIATPLLRGNFDF
jgi:hypothetical protein